MGAAQVVTASPVLSIRGLEKSFRRRPAVSGVDLDVEPGTVYGLIGPDGAGKSTILKAAAGVLQFDSGEIRAFGRPVDSERSAERLKARIGYMPQGLGLNLYPDLSVEENLAFFAELRLVPKDAYQTRRRRLLAMTRLDPFLDRPVCKLSGGMKQKLGLVCSIIHEPELLILDEPTTGVDPVSRRDFWLILAELLAARNMSALIATAYLDEAARFDRVALLHEGRVLAQGPPDDLVAAMPHALVQVDCDDPVEAARRLESFQCIPSHDASLRVLVPADGERAPEAVVLDRLAGLAGRRAARVQPDLEDVFVSILESAAPRAAESSFAPPPPRPAPAGGDPAIQARDLVRDFGGFRAVDGVQFEVGRGEIFGLLGANGAGKTTVLKMLTGLLAPTSGAGRVAGVDMRAAGKAIKARIGYMSQAFSLYLDLTVLENLRLYAGVYGLSRREADRRIVELAAEAGFGGFQDQLAARAPMGVRQRLALACAILHRPQVLFLDEPTSGVDPLGRRAFWRFLLRLAREEGVAVLLTTHVMSEAEHCDRAALMHAGRILADDSPKRLKQDLRERMGGIFEVEASPVLEALAALQRAGARGAVLFGKRIHFFASSDDEAARLVEDALGPARRAGPTPRPVTMEHVFAHLVAAGADRERPAA